MHRNPIQNPWKKSIGNECVWGCSFQTPIRMRKTWRRKQWSVKCNWTEEERLWKPTKMVTKVEVYKVFTQRYRTLNAIYFCNDERKVQRNYFFGHDWSLNCLQARRNSTLKIEIVPLKEECNIRYYHDRSINPEWPDNTPERRMIFWKEWSLN